MRYRKLDANGDYSFGSGQLDFYIDTPETVGQAVQTGLLLFLGEWYLNTDEGTPYIQGALGKYTQAMADLVIKNRITEIQGVTGIAAYTSVLDPIARVLTITATINTLYGPTEIQMQNYGTY